MTKNEALASIDQYIEQLKSEYGLKKRPDVIDKYVDAIKSAPPDQDVSGLEARIRTRLFTHVLYLWAMGKIPGKVTVANSEKLAKKAESLANYLDSLGNHEAAEKQRARAEKLRSRVIEVDVTGGDAVE